MITFFTITMIGLLVVAIPGPDFLIVTQNSLQYGRGSAGVRTSMGVSFANFCHVLLNIIGIGIIIVKSIIIFNLIKIIGAIYLIYFGLKLLKDSFSGKNIETKDIDGSRYGFLSGFYCSIFNPKVCMFYLSFFSVVIPISSSQQERWLYGAWQCLLVLLLFMLAAYFFTNKVVQSRLIKIKSWLERISGLLLVGFGVKLFLIR